jgi:hypothetical protein
MKRMDQDTNISRAELAALARRMRWTQGWAAAASALAVAAVGVALLRGAPTRFGEIQVERIDVVEPDGMKRMVITSAGRFPTDHRAAMAGMLFFNSDGIENGGLVIEGGRKDGAVDHVVHLSMDRYDQDQTVVLRHQESGGTYFSGLFIHDRPATSIGQLVARVKEVESLPEGARAQAMEELKKQSGAESPRRALFGRARDESSVLELADGQGRARARLRVTKDGAAALEFLDEAGAVVASYPGRQGASE